MRPIIAVISNAAANTDQGTTLDLSGMNLTDAELQRYFQEEPLSPQTVTINLRHNKLTKAAFEILKKALPTRSKLQYVYMMGNKITPREIAQFNDDLQIAKCRKDQHTKKCESATREICREALKTLFNVPKRKMNE